MATSILPLLLFSLLAVTASARPCKTLFYFATTTTYYPSSRYQNPNPNEPNFLFQKPSSLSSPRYLTLIFTTTTSSASRFPNHHPSIDRYNARVADLEHDMIPYKGPVKLYSSVSSSIRDRTKDIMSVVGALLFGVGCGVLTAATMYFVWSLFSPHRFDFDDDSSFSSDDDDDVTSAKKMGYLAIPNKNKVVDDDLTKPAAPATEAV